MILLRYKGLPAALGGWRASSCAPEPQLAQRTGQSLQFPPWPAAPLAQWCLLTHARAISITQMALQCRTTLPGLLTHATAVIIL